MVFDAVCYVGEDQKKDALVDATESTRLLGVLDSLGVVFLLTELEERLSDQLGVDIVLADERAMSQKTSPFRRVNTLIKYVNLLVDELAQETE
ncbi:MAG: hypothetical protein COB04_01215 [Gammaproteobacteria bacterium]|nr:MAG: hypothetical protein COB04_01215 [Gammaproteobacteria bacterium]